MMSACGNHFVFNVNRQIPDYCSLNSFVIIVLNYMFRFIENRVFVYNEAVLRPCDMLMPLLAGANMTDCIPLWGLHLHQEVACCCVAGCAEIHVRVVDSSQLFVGSWKSQRQYTGNAISHLHA